LAQYPSNGNQKITLGEQTTADGLIWRGVLADTVRKPSIDTMAYMVLDTTTNIIWHYKKATSNAWLRLNLLPSDTASMLTPYWRAGRFSGVLPVANGGTGSATQNFVDLTNTQTIGGAKTFSSTVTGARFDPTSSSASGNGIYLPAANSLGFSTSGTQKMIILEGGNVGIGISNPSRKLDVNGIIKASIFDVNGEGFFRGDVSGEIQLQTGSTNLSFKNNANNAYLAVITNSGDFGIGTTSPLSKLNVQGSGYFPAKLITLTGAEPTRFSANIGTNLINSTDLALSFGTRSNNINYDNTLNLVNGNVGIGTTTPQSGYRLHVVDSVYVGGNVSAAAYTTRSDYNLKDDIFDLKYGLNDVLKLQPVEYTYKSNSSKQLGFIAQDIGTILPEVVSFEESMSVNYQAIIPILTKAIQEQNMIIKALEQRLLILENK
jgi:hypothetical protein